MGPSKIFGAVTQRLHGLPPLYLFFLVILSVWDYVPSNFEILRHVASRGALDAIASNEARQLHGLRSTRSPSKARAQKRTIDRVSGHQMLEFDHASAIMGRHVDASRSSDQDQMGDFFRIMGLWPTIIAQSWPTIIAQSWPSIGLHRIRWSTIFAAISLIKWCSSSSLLNS